MGTGSSEPDRTGSLIWRVPESLTFQTKDSLNDSNVNFDCIKAVKEKEDAAQPGPSSSPPSDEIEISSSCPPYKKSALEEIFADTDKEDMEVTGVQTTATAELISKEVRDYPSMKRIQFDANPLEFWQTHSKRFPHFTPLALKCMCIQASSVASERVFSTAGDTLTCERSTMTLSKVDKAVFLKKNACDWSC